MIFSFKALSFQILPKYSKNKHYETVTDRKKLKYEDVSSSDKGASQLVKRKFFLQLLMDFVLFLGFEKYLQHYFVSRCSGALFDVFSFF